MEKSAGDWFYHMFLLDNMDKPATSSPMEPEVWSRMPFDLLEKVLLRLPLAAQARFQLVSKAARWYLTSQRFQRERARISVSCGRLPICALVHSGSLSSAGVHRKAELGVPYKVHKLSLDFIPGEFRVVDPEPGRIFFGKGVLYFVNEVFKWSHGPNGRCIGHRICVVNPVNQTWRRLPDLEVKSIAHAMDGVDTLDHVSLMGEEEEGAFQVFVRHTFQCKSAERDDDPWHVYVSTYSTRTNLWKSKLIAYKHPARQISLAHCDVVVGGEFIYGLRSHPSMGSKVTAELFTAFGGKHIRTLAPLPYRPDDYFLGLVEHDECEYMVAVPDFGGTCKILSLHAEDWDVVAALPRDLAMKMAPGVDFDVLDNFCDDGEPYFAGTPQFPFDEARAWVMDFQVAGTFLVISLQVSGKAHVVVYDYISGAWKIVLSHSWSGELSEAPLPWEQALEASNYDDIIYLEARPSLRLGMADCPPKSTT